MWQHVKQKAAAYRSIEVRIREDGAVILLILIMIGFIWLLELVVCCGIQDMHL